MFGSGAGIGTELTPLRRHSLPRMDAQGTAARRLTLRGLHRAIPASAAAGAGSTPMSTRGQPAGTATLTARGAAILGSAWCVSEHGGRPRWRGRVRAECRESAAKAPQTQPIRLESPPQDCVRKARGTPRPLLTSRRVLTSQRSQSSRMHTRKAVPRRWRPVPV